ncbi:MAG: hypothetical protein AB7G11_04250 [Phycisphaerales bacterium]
MRSLKGLSAPLLAAGLSLSTGVCVARADISEQVFVIQATSSLGSATHVVRIADGQWSAPGEFQWNFEGEVPMNDASGNTIAMLCGGSLLVHEDPEVALNFSIMAGSLETAFTISSALVSFASINGAVGQASAGITATDLDGDGVTLSPTNPAGMYIAQYNGIAPTGTTFRGFFSAPVSAPTPFGSTSFSSDYPGGGGFAPIPGDVSDISSRFTFTLSANDIASGTSIFTVVPAPASASLIAFAGVLARRRRR